MKRIALLAVVALAGCGSIVSPSSTHITSIHIIPSRHCGRERWSVKTMTDPAAGKVNLTPIVSSVDALDQSPPTKTSYSLDMPRQPEETKTYVVHAMLTLAKIEADSDFHLVLSAPDGKTMIAEIPDPACAAGSVVFPQLKKTRADFVRLFGDPAHGKLTPNVPVVVRGVAFIDAEHGQTGSGQIGSGEDIELHPVLAISKTLK